MMDRTYDLSLAMMQLECISEGAYELENKLATMGLDNQFSVVFSEISDRLWAVWNILRMVDSGEMPKDFALVMAKADMWDVGIDGEEQ